MKIRSVKEKDYKALAPLINEWWGGRNMSDMLPKLFFNHFTNTSFIAEEEGDKKVDGVSVNTDYDGLNQDRVLFVKQLD
ncbi:hypothetical protein [Bacillus sp. FJAT-42315]|uniref:hypothetical protein n=1 Tax=Bacillus sp. FJAT-42315 TaxID=2014077 RepID=UPI000C23542C|nr:hypothetical protein [Bacillus sp. FJAT-42315]